MEPQPEKLSARESLDIITVMIQEAKGNVQRVNFYFLLWGWVVTIAHLGMYILMQLEYERPYVAWIITIPAWIATFYRMNKQDKTGVVFTHLDKITMWLWLSFGLIIATLVVFGHAINYQLNPVILLVSAIPTFVSGIVLRFTPLVVGGISFWIFAIICFLSPATIQSLLGAAAIICGYLIPGYLLKRKKD